jgi:hypothetical protein
MPVLIGLAQSAVIHGLQELKLRIVESGGLMLTNKPLDALVVAQLAYDLGPDDVMNRECPKGPGTAWRRGVIPEPNDRVWEKPAEQHMGDSMPNRDPVASPGLADIVQQSRRDEMFWSTAPDELRGDRHRMGLIGRREVRECLHRSRSQPGPDAVWNVRSQRPTLHGESRMEGDLPGSMKKAAHHEVNEPTTQTRPKLTICRIAFWTGFRIPPTISLPS